MRDVGGRGYTKDRWGHGDVERSDGGSERVSAVSTEDKNNLLFEDA